MTPAPSDPHEDASTPRVELRTLDTLWFQVAGTICNLACTHCFISCSPTNHTHEMMGLREVEMHLADAVGLGVRECYFTGGEPFLNPQIEEMLAAALRQGPVTVLTNGLLLSPGRCARLAELSEQSPYSLDLRISLDGYDDASNDAIRGAGTFARVLSGVRNLVAVGLNPVVTVTEVRPENGSADGKERFFELLRSLGVEKPRLKILPVFHIGAESARGGDYEPWQRLRASDALNGGWDHLQCSSCRMVTDQGVWVCPILVNEPTARMGARLGDTLGGFALGHSACWTCHAYGVSCRT